MKGEFKGIVSTIGCIQVVEGAATRRMNPDTQLDKYLDNLIALFAPPETKV
jgi:hypothetical protein